MNTLSVEQSYTYIFSLPDSSERDIVKVTFSTEDILRVRRFLDCAETFLDTVIARRGFPIRVNLEFTEVTLSAQWTRPSDDDMAIYLHRYRPLGLKSEDTYFNKIANLLCRRVESKVFRSTISGIKEIFSGTYMQKKYPKD